ncbi:DeoR/GlpR family DNA-binding transcription regulator [Clostridium brassicae]|uniref:DeoR/GlpR family DNA-binding transcription regulator n=1 Tax=Clostridium brassicae TaxID=2999072 RepID=A0ABT4D4D0_9CLOT|nr:DeoR/GlpR family DNA-binding transcription regulator [Clostridium brassicae]MCY6957135.1 DeoR/GlpR family DNA-binding transcription regulator [Clostridium brassicae]
MKSDRLREMENYILKHESVSINTLCSIFDVSKNTIRRDLGELEKKGIIKKVYGGVTLSDSQKDTVPFSEREIKNKSVKQLLCETASSLVNDGDIIFIDSGTTTMHMLPFLADKNNLTIITNNINVLINSLPYPNLNILSTGGSLFRETNSLIGIEAVNFLQNYNISKAFMASTGVSISKGVTNSSCIEYQIKKKVVNKSDNIIVLADESKLGVASLMTYCELQDIDVFITDKTPPKPFQNFFQQNNVNVIVPTIYKEKEAVNI